MPEPEPRRRGISPTFTLFLVLFVVSIGFGLIIPILPLLTRAYGASPLALGAMTASYSVVQFIFSPIWGQISDRVGRKPILMIGITGLSLSFFFMGFAHSFAGLFWARVLGGLLGSATLPSAQALAAEVTGTRNRSRAMGLMGAAFGTGFVVGPVLGGILAPFGMSVPFVVGGIFGTLTVFLAAVILREPRRRVQEGGAHAGTAQAGAGRSGSAGAVPAEGARGLSLLRNIGIAFRGPGAPYYTLAFVIMFTQSTLMTAIAYFFTDRFGVGPETIGLVFAANGAVGAAIQGAAIGAITERLGDRKTILLGLGAGVIGFSALVLSPSLVFGIASVMLLSVSMSLTRPTASSAVSKVTPLPQGVTMGIQSSCDSLGRVVGPLWAGYSYSLSQNAPFLSAAVAGLLALLYIRAATQVGAADPTSAMTDSLHTS